MSWGFYFRQMERDTPAPGHPIHAEAPFHCGVLARDDGHNSWCCARCGRWLAQVRVISGGR